jgi:hypothetical protein
VPSARAANEPANPPKRLAAINTVYQLFSHAYHIVDAGKGVPGVELLGEDGEPRVSLHHAAWCAR